MAKPLGKLNADVMGKHIDNVLDFSSKPRFGADHGVNTTYDAATDAYKNGADWGKDALGDTSPLRDAADAAGGMPATAWRGTAGGVKAYGNGTEAEDPDERHDGD